MSEFPEGSEVEKCPEQQGMVAQNGDASVESVRESVEATDIDVLDAPDSAEAITDKKKWLLDAFKKKDSPVKAPPPEADPGHDLVSSRMKWLADQSKGQDEEVKKSYDASEISGVTAQDRAKWLQDQAFRQSQEESAKATDDVHIGNELVSDRLKRLSEQGKAKGEEVKKSYDASEVSGVNAQNRAKWLQEQAFRKAQEEKEKGPEHVEMSNDLVSDRLKRLAEQGKEEDVKKSYDASEISGVNAQGRATWLQEQAFREAQEGEERESKHVEMSNDLVSDRLKRLAEQGKDEDVKKSYDASEISGVNAQNRAKWLQNQAFRQSQDDEVQSQDETYIGNDLVSGRMKWLAEQGTKEKEVKKSYDASEISGVNAQNRAKWLQEQAFREAQEEKEKEPEHVEMSNDLVSDRLKRLAEQGKEEDVKKSYDASEISGVNAQGRAKWLQEQAFREAQEEKEKGPELVEMSNDLVSDRLKRLAEQGKDEDVKKSYDASEISGVNAQNRAKWLQEQAFREAQEEKEKEPEHVEMSNDLVSDRLKRLAEQGKDEDVKKSYDASEISGVNAQNRAKWLQEQAFHQSEEDKTKVAVEPRVGNDLVSDRMKRLAEHGKGKEEDVKKSYDASEISGISAQGKAKWLQEQASSESQKETSEGAAPEAHVGSDLVSDRMKWLKEKAFTPSTDAPPPSNETESESVSKPTPAEGGVNNAVSAFGGAAKKKSAVQLRRLALEKQEKEMKKVADPRSHMKVSWQQAGSGPGQFKKQSTDARGVAPKKSLKDLP